MRSENRVAAHSGKSLLIIGILGLLLGWADFLGIAIAASGLVWSRWLRPFDTLERAGYYLCWFVLTAWGPILVLLFESHPANWPFKIGFYVTGLIVWLILWLKVVNRLTLSFRGAWMTAIVGTLLTGPVVIVGSAFFFVPLIAGIPMMIATAGPNNAASSPPILWLLMLWQFGLLLAAFLAVYLPSGCDKAKLPASFPEGTKFAVYAGLPLTAFGEESLAWDIVPGRWFDYELFVAQATQCSEAEFRRAFASYKSPVLDDFEEIPIVLPKKFPEGTKFSDYEGTPVASSEYTSWAWDTPGGRRFSAAIAFSRAAICSEAEFRQLVEQENAERLASSKAKGVR